MSPTGRRPRSPARSLVADLPLPRRYHECEIDDGRLTSRPSSCPHPGPTHASPRARRTTCGITQRRCNMLGIWCRSPAPLRPERSDCAKTPRCSYLGRRIHGRVRRGRRSFRVPLVVGATPRQIEVVVIRALALAAAVFQSERVVRVRQVIVLRMDERHNFSVGVKLAAIRVDEVAEGQRIELAMLGAGGLGAGRHEGEIVSWAVGAAPVADDPRVGRARQLVGVAPAVIEVAQTELGGQPTVHEQPIHRAMVDPEARVARAGAGEHVANVAWIAERAEQ
mmetsp:Transcript_21195/g.54733  ORF Transcript_21195/g.54733 Transcript_21195/m.54733 type:complete len:280 (+) Transcript_21195:230-1069(+)